MAAKPQRGPGRPRRKNNAFGKWLDAEGWSRDKAAKRLGIARQYVDALCRGDRRPDLALAFKIQDVTKGEVDARSWLKVPKHSEG